VTTTRDLAQEIDDLSTQQAAVINAIRDYAEHPHDSVDILAACILDAFDKATDELNEVQAEIVNRCACGRGACCASCCSVCRNSLERSERHLDAAFFDEVEQAGRSAFREAGLTNRIDVGDTTTPLDPDDSVALYVRPAERDAFIAYRRAARIQAEAALTNNTIEYLQRVARDTSDALRALLDAITS
jgi:hypothetical protein